MKLAVLKRIPIIYMYSLLLFLLLYSIISFFFFHHQSALVVSWLAILASIIAILYIISATNHVYGHALAFLSYLILTQFGTCFVVYAVPLVELSAIDYYNTGWIYSDSYPKAINLGIIAVITFTLTLVNQGKKLEYKRLLNENINIVEVKKNNFRLVSWIGLLIVAAILLLMIYLVLTGSISLTGSYINFLQFSTSNVGLWSIAMSLLPIGFAFVITMGNKLDLKIVLILYSLISIILLLTGNKGEVLYAVLAGFGIYFYKKNKISKKILFLGLFIVVILIPTITSLRGDNILNNLGNYVFSFADPLLEMGYQIRLSVFMIDGFYTGSREYLLGFSYINPVVNIINRLFPFIPRLDPPIDFDFNTTYDTMGFSQVAESYANLGVIGVILFFIVMGMLLAKFDNTNKLNPKTALYAAWLIIFINMTRNVFAFVIGQMLMVFIIWKIAMIVNNSIKNEYWRKSK